MAFVHLHIHTEYSLLKSTARIDELVQRAKKLNMGALAITDKNVLHGIVPFYKACKKEGIKPLAGIELDIQIGRENAYPLVFLAENRSGYQNLLQLATTANKQGTEPFLTFEELQGSLEGVICLIPWGESELFFSIQQREKERILSLVDKLKILFSEGYLYMEWSPQGTEREKRTWEKAAERFEIPLAAGANVHVIDEGENETRSALEAIKEGKSLKEVKENEDPSRGKFCSEEGIRKRGAPEKALQNTENIANRCSWELPLGELNMPRFPLPQGKSTEEELKRLCEEGAVKRYGSLNEEIRKRLQKELETINEMGFADYFLIVWDFISFAKKRGILVGPGRGSAAGSLVAYVLFITEIDPLTYNLIFERFLNPERISLPDIDIDFPDYRREEVISYVIEKYGKNHVAQIVTFGTFGARAAIRDVGKVLEIPQGLIDRLASMIPSESTSLPKAAEESPELLEILRKDKEAEAVFALASKVEGLPRHTSIHAAGIVMSQTPLYEITALSEGKNDTLVTQFPMNDLEELGLLKMDFLGLKNLTLIEKIILSVKRRTGNTITITEIPLNDSLTFEHLAKGDTTGVFQLESEGMRQVLKNLHPTSFEDIVAVNALYRPGPMENIPVYIDGKHSKRPITYPHEKLRSILEPTYGVIIYQEQIMKIAEELAGYTLAEADLLRRAVSKKDREILEKERLHFVERAAKQGVSNEAAERVYSLIVRFADYGFNRSHAVAYSFIAYQLAYLKAHYPADFYAALITTNINNSQKVGLYLREAKHHGLQVTPPSINKSQAGFSAAGEEIVFGLIGIKHLGKNGVKAILQARTKGNFKSFIDFFMKVEAGSVERRGIESLIKAGAFDELGKDRAVLLASLDAAIEFAEFQRDIGSLFEQGEADFRYIDQEPFTDIEKYEGEKEVTGFYLSGHPLSQYQKVIAPFQPVPLAENLGGDRGTKALAGIIEQLSTIRTKTGQKMAFLSMTDGEGACDVVVFPDLYRKAGSLLTLQSPILVVGVPDKKSQGNKLLANSIFHLDDLLKDASKNLYLKISPEQDNHQILQQVKKVINSYPGPVPVQLFYEKEKKMIQLSDENRVNATERCISQLQFILSSEHVVLKAE